jgi:tRNA G18 (ribose-2'-O)-methylase SpoU
MDRLPYQATGTAAAYDAIERLPVAVLLDNVRSMYNVGAFFRTADAVAVETLCLGGITAYPPQRKKGDSQQFSNFRLTRKMENC